MISNHFPLRPARVSRFISSYEFQQSFHAADGDKDKIITEDEMVILVEKVYAAAQAFIDAPEPEVSQRRPCTALFILNCAAALHRLQI
jgi:hypothetical protein